MASYRKSSAVKLPGFTFPHGVVFSDDRDVSNRFYAALIGQDSPTLQDAAAKARVSLEKLFHCALQYDVLYRGLRGGRDFWVVVANNVDLDYDLDADEVKLVMSIISNARAAYNGNEMPDHLNNLVDGFIALDHQTRQLGPPQTFTVAISPAATAAHQSEQMVSGLASSLQGLNISTPWPPSYFTTQDLVILADKDVAAVLGGVNVENDTTRQPLPPVSSASLPITLRIGLCLIALTAYTIDKDWALFLTPVGFLHNGDRRTWYMLAGRQTKIFATAMQFLAYAGEALTQRGKTFAVGMLTHWLLQAGNLQRTTDFANDDPGLIWTGRELTRRYATVVVLRKVVTPSGMRIQVIWYDPWMHDGTIKKQFGHSQHMITAYRAEVIGTIREWAAANGVGIASRYYGGNVSRAPGVAGDSVRQCLTHLDGLAATSRMAEQFPDHDDQEGFERLGYLRSE